MRGRLARLLLSVVVMTGACHDAAAPVAPLTAGAAAAPRGDPIVIGGTLDLSGPLAAESADIMAAYALWADDVNAGGGLLGRPVEVVVYDDGARPASARSLYRRLIVQDDADLLLAPNAPLVAHVLPLAEASAMLLFNGGPASAALRSEWLVDVATYTEADQARGVFELIDALPARRRPWRVGVVTVDDPVLRRVRDGVDGRGGVLQLARERDLDVVFDEEHPDDAGVTAAAAVRARRARVDLFFALVPAADAAALARGAREADFTPAIFCACGEPVAGTPAWEDLGAAGEGIVFPAMAWTSDRHPGIAALSAQVRARSVHGGLPVRMTSAYAILQVIEEAVLRAGAIDQPALRAQVAGQVIDTAVGRVAFDGRHIPAFQGIVVQSRRGGDQVVWPPQRATAAAQMPVGG